MDQSAWIKTKNVISLLMAASIKQSMGNKKRAFVDSKGPGKSPRIKKMKKSENTAKPLSNKKSESGKRKKSMPLSEKLKKQDPEFYEFLKEEDEGLLNFDDVGDDFSDSAGESDEGVSGDSDMLREDSDDDELMKAIEAKETKRKKKKDANNDQNESSEISDSDVEDDDSEDEDEEEDEEFGQGQKHKLPKKLEVASDDSDDEEEENEEIAGDSIDKDAAISGKNKGKSSKVKVTMTLIKNWTDSLEKQPTAAVLTEVMSAFKAALLQMGRKTEVIKYTVKGSMVFNAVVRMCLTLVSPSLHKVLGLPPLTDLQQKPSLPSNKNKKWRKLKVVVKSYITDVLKLLSEVSDTSMINVILKHIHKMTTFYSFFPKTAKAMLKKMIKLWSSSEESTRVVTFLCIHRLVQMMRSSLLEPCLKQMYMAYVKNCRFTSPDTLPLINFMQRSLVEIFSIDVVLGYQYTFVYIRQLAIHLRNAISVKKQETCQAVYNWQFIHCIGLWVKFLSLTYPNEALEPLIYPLTQTIIGTIKLQPTARYFPLRFHLVASLNTLSRATKTFIPVLPFLLEVFEQTDFNKKYKNLSFKPLNFACILKLSKSQLEEKIFKDGVIDQLYELFLEQFHIHAHKVGFPELALPAVIQMKEFLKKCKVANYCKQIKQIIEKVEENSGFINNKRKALNLSLSNTDAIEAWEEKWKTEGTPIGGYYSNWRKLRDRELQHQIAQKELISGDDNLPEVIRPQKQKASKEEKEEFADLFASDSEESDDDTRFLLKEERPQKSKTKKESDSDDYSDFDSDELEQLAGSADDDSDEDTDANSSDDKEDDDDDDNDGNDDEDMNAETGEEDSDAEDIVEEFHMSDDD